MSSMVLSSPRSCAVRVTHLGVRTSPYRVTIWKSSGCRVSGAMVCDSTTGMPSFPEAPKQRAFALNGRSLSSPKTPITDAPVVCSHQSRQASLMAPALPLTLAQALVHAPKLAPGSQQEVSTDLPGQSLSRTSNRQQPFSRPHRSGWPV